MNVVIRQATNDDLEAVLFLHSQLELDKTVPMLSVEEARKILGRFKNYPDYRLYVATLDGKTVGTFALLIMDNLAHLGAPSGIVEDVVVLEDLQGQGIGKQMMEFAMDLCREKGCYKVALSSNMRREAAHGFYESLGFARQGYSFGIELGEKRF